MAASSSTFSVDPAFSPVATDGFTVPATSSVQFFQAPNQLAARALIAYLSQFDSIKAARANLATQSDLAKRYESFIPMFEKTLMILEAQLNALLNFVDNGKEAEAKALLEANRVFLLPLLTYKSQWVHRGTDKNGETDQIYENITLFQLAYGEDDPEMRAMLSPFFEEAYNSKEKGEIEKQRQFDEKYSVPPSVGNSTQMAEDVDKKRREDLEALLKPFLDAISEEQFGGVDATNKYPLSQKMHDAIAGFKTAFIESQPKTIKHGVRFDLRTLYEIYAIYATKAKEWEYDYKRFAKCALFEDAILTVVLNYVAKNDAQRFCQGLYYLENKNPPEAFTRRADLRYGGGDFYESLVARSAYFHLDGSCVSIGRGTGGNGLPAMCDDPGRRRAALQNLCRAKTAELANHHTPRATGPRLG